MSTTPREINIGGEIALVTYLDENFIPVEPDKAVMAKAIYPDGRRSFFTIKQPSMPTPKDS